MPVLNVIKINQKHLLKVKEAKERISDNQIISPLFYNSFNLWNKHIKNELKKAQKSQYSQTLAVVECW